jgi:uncharacterized protein GlcG (DUF336 family)
MPSGCTECHTKVVSYFLCVGVNRSIEGTSRFWARFAVAKAVGAAALQVDTATSADQVKTNPRRFHSALSMLEAGVLADPRGESRWMKRGAGGD